MAHDMDEVREEERRKALAAKQTKFSRELKPKDRGRSDYESSKIREEKERIKPRPGYPRKRLAKYIAERGERREQKIQKYEQKLSERGRRRHLSSLRKEYWLPQKTSGKVQVVRHKMSGSGRGGGERRVTPGYSRSNYFNRIDSYNWSWSVNDPMPSDPLAHKKKRRRKRYNDRRKKFSSYKKKGSYRRNRSGDSIF